MGLGGCGKHTEAGEREGGMFSHDGMRGNVDDAMDEAHEHAAERIQVR